MSNRKKTSKSKEKETDWQERIVQVRRVTKVVKGGKKLSFRAILIIGNEKGQVGVGVGKASVRWGNNRSLKSYDGNKKIKGIKRHIVVDKNGE